MDSQPDFEQMYYTLFRSVTHAATLLEQGNAVRAYLALVDAQRTTEEMYIAGDEDV